MQLNVTCKYNKLKIYNNSRTHIKIKIFNEYTVGMTLCTFNLSITHILSIALTRIKL